MASQRTTSTVTKSTSTPSSNETPTKLSNDTSAKPSRLLYFHEIPSWQQDNEYVLSGYRPTSGSAWLSFASLSYINNQTVNTYSHLLGAGTFAVLPLYFYIYIYRRQPNVRLDDLLVNSVYCYGVAVCFMFSSIFHILWNHSHKYASFCNKLDYLGILVLMWGAGIPTIYYGFLCNRNLKVVYWTMTTSTAICCTILTLNPHFASPRFRKWRAALYAGFGLSSVIFVVHGLAVHGWELQKSRMSLVWMGWMATANLTGAAIYAARIPERWVPYRFDIWGASHQILHVAVMIAAWIHFCGLIEAFQIVRSIDDPCGVGSIQI